MVCVCERGPVARTNPSECGPSSSAVLIACEGVSHKRGEVSETHTRLSEGTPEDGTGKE